MFLAKAGLVCCLLVLPMAGCIEIPEDRECGLMRQIGLTSEKSGLVRDWIESALADPGKFAGVSRTNGNLAALVKDIGLDWGRLGIPARSSFVEFYGPAVDYRDLKRESVEAVVIGHGRGYKLIFKLQARTDIEQKLIEESKKPYGDIRMETLGPDLVLVCQVNRFG